MRWDIWLSQTRTQRQLNTAVRVGAGTGAVWLAAAGFFFWSTHCSLAEEHAARAASLQSQEAIRHELPRKSADARRAATLRVAHPEAAGGVEFADEVASIAQTCDVQLLQSKFGAEVQGAAAQTAAPLPPAPGVTPASGAAAAPVSAWISSDFEIQVSGEYAGLNRFQERLAASPRLFDIKGVSWNSTDTPGAVSSGKLRVQIKGTLYGKPGK